MKLAIKNNVIIPDITTLKNISESSISEQRLVWVTGASCSYMYFSKAVTGSEKPNDQTNGTGFWCKDITDYGGHILVVDEDYDFSANTSSDITSIKNWYAVGEKSFVDYAKWRNEIIFSFSGNGGWSGATSVEKDIIIDLHIDDPYIPLSASNMNKVAYLMGKGYSQAQAQGYLLQSWYKHHLRHVECAKERWKYVKLIVGKYLNLLDANELMETTDTLVYYYTQTGRMGQNYNPTDGDGIMDYIESTHGFTGIGLEDTGYVLNTGTWSDFKKELRDIIAYGKYTKYED